MKILLLDIESAPNLVYTWGLFKQNISPSQIVKAQYVLCWAAKWLGEDDIFFDSLHHSSVKAMLKGIHKLLDQADAVCHQYGSKFDIPMLNTEFVKHGMKPPSPYKQIDLKNISSNKFRFASSKLEHVAPMLDIGEKIKEDVKFELWIACMAGDHKAWEKMKKYNIQDCALLEGLYRKYQPWIDNHPNRGAYQDNKEVCPNCGGHHYHRRGVCVSKLMAYPRFHCQDCGKWFRSNKTVTNRGLKKYVGIPD